MMQQLKIAAIQMIAGRDSNINLATAQRLVREAAASGARLVLLPEFFILITDADDPQRHALAEELGHGPIQDSLAELARSLSIYLLAGTLMIKSPVANKFYNSTIIFAPDGRQLAHYHKMHLFKFTDAKQRFDEEDTFTPGSDLVTCAVDGFTLGLAICYDLRFPELFRGLGVVDAIALPAAFTNTTGAAHWEILCRARAIENQCYFIAIDQGGDHPCGRKTYGHSLVIDPWGSMMASCVYGETIIYATLDKAKISAVRGRLPALEHRKC